MAASDGRIPYQPLLAGPGDGGRGGTVLVSRCRCCCCSGMAEGGGRPGGGGRRRRRRRRQEGTEDESPGAAAERQRRRLQEARSELKDSEFWDSSRRTILKSLGTAPAAEQDAFAALGKLREALLEEGALEGPDGRAPGLQCVCYGLGSFCSCAKARLQLAFLLLLLEELKISPEMCFVFDPIFSTLETEVLSSLGLTVLRWNEEGKRSIGGPTLFYMVHCGKALYNNLLWSNWSVGALSQMVVVGNSFRGFEERLPAKVFHENYSYVAKVLEATQEEALPPHLRQPDVFNDTSVHRFPLRKLRALPQDCWACPREPVYPEEDQLEIIRTQPATFPPHEMHRKGGEELQQQFRNPTFGGVPRSKSGATS